MSRNEVLERNIERLLRVSYVPAPCRPEFREVLLTRLLDQVCESPSARSWTRWSRIAVAASLLVGAGIAAWSLVHSGKADESRGLQTGISTGGPSKVDAVVADGGVAPGDGGGARTPREPIAPKTWLDTPNVGSASRPSETAVLALAGLVKDGATGRPIEDFAIGALRSTVIPDGRGPRHEAFAAAGGRFELGKLEAGDYTVVASAPGYAARRIDGVKIPSEGGGPLVFALDGGGRARGQVLDVDSGEPVAGAVVLSEPDSPHSFLVEPLTQTPKGATAVLTDAAGRFDFLHLQAGAQILRVSKRGYAPAWSEPFELAAGEEKSDLRIRVGHGGTIRGRVHVRPSPGSNGFWVVTYAGGATPRRAAAGSFATVAGARQEYSLENVALGANTVVLLESSKEGPMAPRQVQSCVVDAGKEARVDFGAPEGGASIEGRVKSVKVLSPRYTMSLCRVEDPSPTGGWKATVIAPEGTFRFDALEGGPHELYLATPGGDEVVKVGAVEVPLSGVVKVDVELPAGTIEGTVAAASNGAPIAGAILLVERGDAPVGTGEFLAKILTNADGTFAVPFLPPGSYRLTAYDPTGARAAQRVEPLTVAEGRETPKVRLYLGLAGSIQVTVRDAKGAPVGDIEIQLTDSAGRAFEFHADRIVTDEKGRWTASGVPPGRWSVRALDEARKIGEGTVEVREQGVATIEFTVVR